MFDIMTYVNNPNLVKTTQVGLHFAVPPPRSLKGSLILGDQWLGRKRDVILLVVILDGFSKFVFFCAAVMSKVVSDAIEQIMESPSPPSGSAEVFRLSTKMSTHPGNTSVLTCLTPSEVLRQLVLNFYCVFCYLSWEMFSFSVPEEGRCLYGAGDKSNGISYIYFL